MAVTNDHLSRNCRVWDGLSFQFMTVEDADAAEKAGRVQRTENLTASQLKRPDQFTKKTRRKTTKKPKQTYATREMRSAQTAEMTQNGEPD